MRSESEDTVIVPPRAAPRPAGVDLDDTVLGTPVATPAPVDAPAAQPARRPRPVAHAPAAIAHYGFRVGSREDVIPLDVPCYVGRRPTSPRVVSGTPPRLVRVASPQQEVSATHLEVRQLGASVIVTDLRTTNGSVVMLPGAVPRKLLQGESVVVSSGTLVDIGDENILQILPMHGQA